MRPTATAICLLGLLFPGMPADAQEQRPVPDNRRVVTNPTTQRQPVRSNPQMPVRSQPVTLSENHTISLEGQTSAGQEVELSLTGIGPEFMTDHSLEDGTIMSCQYQVTEGEGGLILDYTIGMRVRVTKTDKVTSSQKGVQNVVSSRVEYREEMTRGKLRCRPGEPVVILKGKNHSLSLTISKSGTAKRGKKP